MSKAQATTKIECLLIDLLMWSNLNYRNTPEYYTALRTQLDVVTDQILQTKGDDWHIVVIEHTKESDSSD